MNLRDRVDRAGARAPEPAPADPEPLTHGDRIAALRDLFYSGALAMTPAGVTIGTGPHPAPELAAALTADMSAHPNTLMILLSRDEIDRALAAIDSGQWFMTWAVPGNDLTARVNYRPWPIWGLPRDAYSEHAALASAVHTACQVAAAQIGQLLGYEVSGDLADLRQWLADFVTILQGEAEA